jgi:1-acyl-sn-glycerol-3-phosphate acyltransferase
MKARAGLPPLPPHVPQFRPSRWRRACARALAASGWGIGGELPDVPRLVLIAAPHTSWWDGVWGLLMKIALGIDIAFMAKRELFRGPLGWALRRLGGMPIERSAAHGVVDQMIERMRGSEKLWLGIAPEGTRKRVARWKTGFWQIARASGVPILPVAFDYPSKTIVIGPLFRPGTDVETDLAALRAFYAPYRGKYRGVAGDA